MENVIEFKSQSNPALRTPTEYGHLVITDSFPYT